LEFTRPSDAFETVCGLAHNFEAFVTLQQCPDATAKQGVIIDQ
jgi:hypothetical protein